MPGGHIERQALLVYGWHMRQGRCTLWSRGGQYLDEISFDLRQCSRRRIAGDVPLFVEHCEAVVAEVDVTRRWLGEQGRCGLSFSFDVLSERLGVPEVACELSVGGSLLLLLA